MVADEKGAQLPEEAENTAENTAEKPMEQPEPPAGGLKDEKVGKIEDILTLEVDIMSSPLFILVTLMAYIAECGGREVPVEQKAEFVSILRKHVKKADITESEMHLMVRDAFEQTLRIEFSNYLEKVLGNLTMGQRYSIIANLYNIMMVDGELRDGEEGRIDLCRRSFELDPAITRQIRRVLMVKNDTAVFLNKNHPGNDPDYSFSVDHS